MFVIFITLVFVVTLLSYVFRHRQNRLPMFLTIGEWTLLVCSFFLGLIYVVTYIVVTGIVFYVTYQISKPVINKLKLKNN